MLPAHSTASRSQVAAPVSKDDDFDSTHSQDHLDSGTGGVYVNDWKESCGRHNKEPKVANGQIVNEAFEQGVSFSVVADGVSSDNNGLGDVSISVDRDIANRGVDKLNTGSINTPVSTQSRQPHSGGHPTPLKGKLQSSSDASQRTDATSCSSSASSLIRRTSASRRRSSIGSAEGDRDMRGPQLERTVQLGDAGTRGQVDTVSRLDSESHARTDTVGSADTGSVDIGAGTGGCDINVELGADTGSVHVGTGIGGGCNIELGRREPGAAHASVCGSSEGEASEETRIWPSARLMRNELQSCDTGLPIELQSIIADYWYDLEEVHSDALFQRFSSSSRKNGCCGTSVSVNLCHHPAPTCVFLSYVFIEAASILVYWYTTKMPEDVSIWFYFFLGYLVSLHVFMWIRAQCSNTRRFSRKSLTYAMVCSVLLWTSAAFHWPALYVAAWLMVGVPGVVMTVLSVTMYIEKFVIKLSTRQTFVEFRNSLSSFGRRDGTPLYIQPGTIDDLTKKVIFEWRDRNRRRYRETLLHFRSQFGETDLYAKLSDEQWAMIESRPEAVGLQGLSEERSRADRRHINPHVVVNVEVIP